MKACNKCDMLVHISCYDNLVQQRKDLGDDSEDDPSNQLFITCWNCRNYMYEGIYVNRATIGECIDTDDSLELE